MTRYPAMAVLMVIPLAVALLILLTAGGAHAAELRPIVTLSGPHVHLRDLFDDAGPHADRVLGPGPLPGGRIIIAAAQLGAIARQFGVDWRPASSGDRAILEWPGRPLRKDDAQDAVRMALVAAGADPDCVIDLAGFVPPLVPLGADPRPMVQQLDFNHATGRFTAVLSIVADGMDPLSTRIGGTADTLVELPVLAVRLPSGSVVRRQDLRLAKISGALAKGDAVREPARAVGMMLRRSVAAGQPLRADDLISPPVVTRDAMVRVLLDTAGLSVSGQGQALQTGAVGDRIRMRNPTSRAVLEVEVVGPGVVRVIPGSMPLALGPIAQAGLAQ